MNPKLERLHESITVTIATRGGVAFATDGGRLTTGGRSEVIGTIVAGREKQAVTP